MRVSASIFSSVQGGHYIPTSPLLLMVVRAQETVKVVLKENKTKQFALPGLAELTNLLASLGHIGGRRVVLGHTLNTLQYVITKKILYCFK